MYKNLNKTIGSEENKAHVNAIKDRLAKLIKKFKSWKCKKNWKQK